MRQAGLFGLTKRLSKDDDSPGVLEATVDLEFFRLWLAEGPGYGDGSKGGRPPFDPPDATISAHVEGFLRVSTSFSERAFLHIAHFVVRTDR